MIADQTKIIFSMIQQLSYQWGRRHRDGTCCENLSLNEFQALRAALFHRECTVQEIARGAEVTKSGATRLVNRLEEKGLVRREEDPKDGRICCVTLTDQGASLLSRIENQLLTDFQSVLATMDPALRDILIISLGSLLQASRQLLGKPGNTNKATRTPNDDN
ncbi:MAG: MarR family winged helix-turn-helix transcriptional regulator [Syntrophales bacterium]